jgi:hypothetical protein
MSINKLVEQKFDMEVFNLKNLNDIEVKEEYEVKNTNRFAALGNLAVDDYMDISRAGESITENIRSSTTESLG